MMISTKIWLDLPCRHENDFLIFNFNMKNQKISDKVETIKKVLYIIKIVF